MVIAQIGLERALEIVAKWLSGKKNLFVNWHKGTEVSAIIEKGIINIPVASCSAAFDEKAMTMLRANVYHECGHIYDSNPVGLKGTKFFIYNCLEDVRMEAVISKLGDGIRGELLSSNEEISKLHGEKFSKKEGNVPAWKEALFYMMFENMYILPKWKLSDSAKELYDIANTLFNKVNDTKNSQECAEIAQEIYRLWKNVADNIETQEKKQNEKKNDEQGKGNDNRGQDSKEGRGDNKDQGDGKANGAEKEEKGKPSKGQGQGKGNGEKGDNGKSSKEEKSSGSENGEEEDDGKNLDGKPNGKKEDGNNEGESSQGCGRGKTDSKSNLNRKNPASDLDMDDDGYGFYDVAKEVIKLAAEEINTDPNYYTSYREKDFHNRVDILPSYEALFQTRKQEIGADIGLLIRNAEEALASLRKNYDVFGLENGEIDYNCLPEIAFGLTPNVYFQNFDGIDVNTCVEIVVDQSGSMGSGKKAYGVQNVLIALGEMLNRIDIPFEIIGTTTEHPQTEMKQFTRWKTMKFLHYKGFDESWISRKSSVMFFGGINNNIDGEAIEFAYAQLQNRPEKRKIIFSVCDGIPESGQGNDAPFRNQLKVSAERIRQNGVEVYSIGVDTEKNICSHPKDFYGEDFSIEVNSDNTSLFSNTVITKIINTILSGGFSS